MNPRFLILSTVVLVICFVGVSDFADPASSTNQVVGRETSALNGQSTAEKAEDEFSPYVDELGNISLPDGFARTWTHLGSWAVARNPGEAIHELHNVYTEPKTIDAYNESGEFPDGAVLVKEVRDTSAGRLTAGHAAWSTDTKIWFVMIKDRKERFKGNGHWGDGWGWALFEAKDPTKNVSAGYETSCLACHTPVVDRDWVYTYGYRVLKDPN